MPRGDSLFVLPVSNHRVTDLSNIVRSPLILALLTFLLSGPGLHAVLPASARLCVFLVLSCVNCGGTVAQAAALSRAIYGHQSDFSHLCAQSAAVSLRASS